MRTKEQEENLFQLIEECSELVLASVKYWKNKDDKAEKKERTET